MQQSNIIFGALLIAFIVFITVRGELPVYLSLLRGSSANGQGIASTANPNSGDIISNVTGIAKGGAMTLDTAKKIIDVYGGGV